VIDSKKAARLRHKVKTGNKLSAANQRALDEYEAARTAKAEGKEPDPAAPESEVKTEKTEIHETPPPVDSAPPPPVNEAPPPVPPEPAVKVAGAKSGDWRDKWRAQVSFSGDGRQMLCEQIGMSIVEGLSALRDETAKVVSPKTPDPRALAGMFVLAMDDLLPERAKLTPKIGAAVVTIGTVGERYYHADKIAEFMKTDPEHQAWLRKQAERERNEQEQRKAHEAETATPIVTPSGKPTHPEPATPPPPVNGYTPPKTTRAIPLSEDPDALI
jgi:hypothetical protein